MSSECEQHHQTELLAYELWEKRGKPFGSPEQDWYRAQAEMNRKQPDELGTLLYAVRFGPSEE